MSLQERKENTHMLVKMHCPQCGAVMEVDGEQTQVFCSYCGTRMAIAALIIGTIMCIFMIAPLTRCSGRTSEIADSPTYSSSLAELEVTERMYHTPSPKPVETEIPETPEPQPTEEQLPTEEPTTEPTEEPAPTTDPKGIRPEFQKSMDEYIAFFEKYCEFMKQYKESPSFDMLLKYADMMYEYEKMEKAFLEIDESDLTPAEVKLYLDTNNKIEKMLLDIP
jgi:type IV secretory pathway VirB10-like protein